MEQLIRLLPIIFRLINIAPQIQEAIRTGVPTVKAVEENARDLLPILAQVGKQLFPEVDDKFAPAAAATAMFDPVRATCSAPIRRLTWMANMAPRPRRP